MQNSSYPSNISKPPFIPQFKGSCTSPSSCSADKRWALLDLYLLLLVSQSRHSLDRESDCSSIANSDCSYCNVTFRPYQKQHYLKNLKTFKKLKKLTGVCRVEPRSIKNKLLTVIYVVHWVPQVGRKFIYPISLGGARLEGAGIAAGGFLLGITS